MRRDRSSWVDDIQAAMEKNGEQFPNDIEAAAPALDSEAMRKRFDHSYGSANGCAFTVWTKGFVYFPGTYDGAEWVACVARHPQAVPEPTDHVGGG